MLRNTAAFATKAAALTGLTKDATDDGVIKLARYTDGDKTKTLFGIYNTINSSYTVYDFDTDAETALVNLVNTINGDENTNDSFRKAIKDKVESLDYSGNTAVGKFVTNVTETDGIIAVTIDTVSASVVAQSSEKAAISGLGTVQAALDALADKAAAITITAADKSINVNTAETGTTIAVNIKSGENVITLGNDGIYTDIKLSGITPSSTIVAEEYALIATNGDQLGSSIKIYKDSSLVNIFIGHVDDVLTNADASGESVDTAVTDGTGDTALVYIMLLNDGKYKLAAVNVESFLQENEFKSGVTVDANSHIVRGVVDPSSENFLTVGADGFKLDGVQNAITSAIEALDVTGDTAVAGQYVAAIQEADGIVSVKTRANVSEAVLTNYTKGADSGTVAATDTVNEAISKLEKQVEAAKAAATTKVEKDNAASHLTLSSGTAADGSVTYTIGESDIASNSDLSAETVARKAIDGQNGQTYAANTSSNYISGATSLNDADVKLAAALKAEEDARIAADSALTNAINALDASTVAEENSVVVDVTQENGQISATTGLISGVKLSGYTVGGDDSGKIAATDTLGTALGKLQGQINGMDKAASAEDGKVVTTVTEADGKVTETKANVKDLQLGGYAKTNDTGDIASGDTINVALSKLENKSAAITIANADGSINVNTAATGTDINVNIKSGEHVLAKTGDAGLYTNIKLSAETITETNVREQYALFGTDGTKLGASIKIYKDSSLTNIYIGHVDDILTNADGSGESPDTAVTSGSGDAALVYIMHLENDKYKLAAVNVESFLEENEFASGVTATNHVVHGVVDTTSETFLTVGADGFKLSGVQDAIDAAQASATTEVALKTGENVLELSADTTAADGHVKYILNTKDVASATLLADTISGAGLNVDGSYAQNANAKYIATASSLADADDKLDAALFALSGKVGDVGVSGQNAIAVAEGTPGNKDYTVSLTLKKPDGVDENLLSQDASGLTYSTILDCGTY